MGIIRGAFDDAMDASKASNPTLSLRVILRQYETAARDAISQGSISHLGMGSRSTGFSVHAPGQITPAEWQLVWRFLIDEFDDRKNDFVRCGTANPTDAQIYTAMMCRDLVAVTTVYPDFSLVDLPASPGWLGEGRGILA